MLFLLVIFLSECSTETNLSKNLTNPPVTPLLVNINSPTSLTVFQQDELITFSGSAQRGNNEQLTGEQLKWTSNRDGLIGVGNGFTRSGLSAGEHLITLTATTTDSTTAFESVRIINQPVTNGLEVRISTPAGYHISQYDSISLKGSAFFPDGSPLTNPLALEWRSSLESDPSPILGNGFSIAPAGLTPGLHTITLTVNANDGNGNMLNGTASIEVFVDFANTNVQLDILQPQNGFVMNTGEELTCVGSVSITGNESIDNIVWTSSIDRVIGFSETCIVPSLSPGTHRITMTATTTSGKKATRSIIVNVN